MIPILASLVLCGAGWFTVAPAPGPVQCQSPNPIVRALIGPLDEDVIARMLLAGIDPDSYFLGVRR